ncbi:flagellar assembly protein FliH [Peribacillus cavernae]|uniref:flagellar assembly protein FliH n=1 Tax=Peribacillus cavernae TaxID=1674310 RepID=UPI00163CBBA8|nr:flagellar assembly protein FliH [Peribacillus cavernae]MDQ0217076.1 flagellar assembly protein FliH [Peribacillus cavernae]
MSRIIKSQFANTILKKKINIREFDFLLQGGDPEAAAVFQEIDAGNVTEQAKSEAEAIVIEARQQAEKILRQAEASRMHFEEVEKMQMVQEARELGFNEGIELGKQRGYEECAAAIEHAREIVASSKNDYLAHIEASERTILELGIKVSERIIGTRLEDSEQVYMSIAKQAIKEAKDHPEVELHVHPVHYQYFLAHKEELSAIFHKETRFYIYPDQGIGETSCIIESTHGRIDAGIDSQLKEIKLKLVELLEGE